MRLGIGIGIGAGGGAPPFTPASVSGMALWLDAAQGVTEDTGKVASWADQSGNGNNAAQGTAGLRPTKVATVINSLPVVRFTAASSTRMTGAIASGFNTATLYIVGRVRSAGNHAFFQSSDGAGAVNDGLHLFYETTAWKARRMKGAVQDATSATFATNTAYVISVVYNTTTSIYINGTKGTDATNAQVIDTQSVYQLGSLFGTTYPGDVDIAELIYYSGAHSDTNRDAIEAWLGTKYAITVA